MPSRNKLVPWWLQRPYEFVNATSPFGDYVDNPRGAGGAMNERLFFETAARQNLLRRLGNKLPCHVEPPALYAGSRDFRLGLTILLDHARQVALSWRRPSFETMQRGLQEPNTKLNDQELARTRRLVDRYATTQRTLDLFGRLEPAAIAPIYDAGGRLLHPGEAELINRLFEQLPPGGTVDLGGNGLTEQALGFFHLEALDKPFAFNLAGNVVTSGVVRNLLGTGTRSLRHFHCRSGLQLDQAGLNDLLALLRAQPALESLELGFASGGSTPAGLAVSEAPLALAGLFTLPARQLRSLYLHLPTAWAFDLGSFDLATFPALEQLALDLVPTHPALGTWRPFVQPFLHQVWLPQAPDEQQQAWLRFVLNAALPAHERFVSRPHAAWLGYFDRYVGTLNAAEAWCLRRPSWVERQRRPTEAADFQRATVRFAPDPTSLRTRPAISSPLWPELTPAPSSAWPRPSTAEVEEAASSAAGTADQSTYGRAI